MNILKSRTLLLPQFTRPKDCLINPISLSSIHNWYEWNMSTMWFHQSTKDNTIPDNNHAVRALVVCGPSGSGKTTLLEMLISHFQDSLKFSVSHTTRQPRPNELEGKSYYFVNKSTFEEMIANKEFVEYSLFSGNYYGTSHKELSSNNDRGLLSLLDVDIRGVINLKNKDFNAKYIFIKPPSIEFLERNLRKRGTETNESIRTRIKQALDDMKLAESVYFDLIVENQDLSVSFEKLKKFVQTEVTRFKEYGV